MIRIFVVIVLAMACSACLIALFFLEQNRRFDRAYSVPIYTYHDVIGQGEISRARMAVSAAEFENQLKLYQKERHVTISMDDLYEYVTFKRRSLPKHPLILTFDDTWKGHALHALPLLKQYDFEGTFYINSGWVSSSAEFMSWEDIRMLKAAGMEIGGHTISHTELKEDVRTMWLSEIIEDKKRIESELGATITTFAYPYNTHSAEVIALLKESGYTTARTGLHARFYSLLSLPSQIVE